jgi:hypothetical protein
LPRWHQRAPIYIRGRDRTTLNGGDGVTLTDGIIFSAFEHRAVKQDAVTNNLEIDLQLGYAKDVDGNRVSWEPGDIEDVTSGDGDDQIYTDGAATGVNTVDCGGGHDWLTHGSEDPPVFAVNCEEITEGTS